MTTVGGHILQPTDDGRAEIAAGVVEFNGARINQVTLGDIPASVDHGDDRTLICPGFIDAHLHLPQFDSIGATGMPLLQWLHQVIFPAEARWNDLAFAERMIERVIGQCLAVGTTGICGYATVSHPAAMAALEAFSRRGFRGVIGQVMMDQAAPAELCVEADRLLGEVTRTLQSFPPGGRLAAAVTPRFALSCNPQLLAQAGELAARHQACVQTHLAETREECTLVERGCGVQRYVDAYHQAGLLGPRTILGHGIYLDQVSQQLLKETDSLIAHCPTANAFLGSGTMSRRDHRRHGIRIALGSDIGAGFERCMVRVGRAMIDAAMRLAMAAGEPYDDPEIVPTARHAWHQITAGNADALGWTDAGRIRVGAAADVLVIRPDIPWLESIDPLSTLMFAWDDRWLKQGYLRGRLEFDAVSELRRGER
jgi:guanine deaminase